MSMTIYRRIPEIDPKLIEDASDLAVADLHESMDIVRGRMALLSARLRPLQHGLRICGQAVTAYVYPGDALPIHKAIQLLRPGQVLVVANSETAPATMFAELVALAARQKGAIGAVVDGCIRDSDALRKMAFPIWASGTHSGHTEKRGPGAVNVPVICGGVRVEPGDVIVADDDGVIAIPPALLRDAIAKARTRGEREIRIRAAIDCNEMLFDILGLGAALEAAGATEHDRIWSEDPRWE